ncbi:non-ribosomal peptide synthetase [Nocardia blacklockiae]|uniref:non-ribosomal peptide synthetase n=1 Tax=Nocardia blacklockiae TaxID=480036 RepID=UPI0018940DC8|nr:non-ribosomal peptide synthetase [Nocardia blacklockiae]MBF6171761.1 amino acid adenylation domain-containing protein [Nocardia blacklockiae]
MDVSAVGGAATGRAAELPALGGGGGIVRGARDPETGWADATLTDLVDARLAAGGAAIAVRAGDETLTCAELSRRADSTAALLRSRGVGPGALVAVLLERSARMPVALLAVLRAGAAYLPLDPAHPRKRLEFLLADAAPACVLTSAELSDLLPDTDLPLVLIDSDPVPAHALRVRARPDDPVYVIYTSGSTGMPKGVVITHANVVQLFTHALPRFDFREDDVWTVFHSFAFDFAVWELWGALLTGGTAVVVDHTTSRSPDLFRELLVRERVTVVSQTPSAFGLLDAADRVAPPDPPLALRYLIFGGEALVTAELADWFDRHGEHTPRLVNMYGITEATVHVTLQPLDRRAATSGTVGSNIGNGLPGVGTRVLDHRLRPVPGWGTGEIYVAGNQVARGYLGRPGLTAARFVADPYGPPGARMYRSGDLVRRAAHGLEYLRRGDQQIQLRGFRIEPGEIEAVLRRCADADAKVVVRDGRLLAYVRGAAPDTLADLERQLAEHLPEHLVPAAIIVVDSWPLTVNGKLDVRSLPAPDFRARSTGRPPRTDREHTLAAIFREVLGLTEIGIDDDFFRMGGDSLSAVRLRARILRELGEQVQVQDIFRHRTVAGLAALSAGSRTLPSRADSVRGDLVPLSFPQRRLLELNAAERAGDSPGRAYVLPLRLAGSTPPAAVARALADLVGRHEILRTVFPGQQLVLADALDFETVAGGGAPRVAAVAAQPFDLRAQVPLRARLFPDRRGDLLLLVLHQVAADGWSLAPLVQDLGTALRARLAGEAPAWQPLPLQYAEHAIWQHRLVDGADGRSPIAGQLAYWRETLAELPTVPAPSRAPGAQPLAHRIPLRVDAARYRRLVDSATAADVSVFMLAHTAFTLTLGEFGYGTDIAVCVPTAGRTEAGMEEMVGRCTNFLVLRTRLDDAPDFARLLGRVRRISLAAMDNQDVPFEYLTEALGIADRLRIRLAFQNIPASDLRGAGLDAAWEPLAEPAAPADWDISLVLTEEKDENSRPRALFGFVEYADDALDKRTAKRLAARFDTILFAGLDALPAGNEAESAP